jgi:aryl-alcohol dehydrogenase-like predicted oxidoreductase
MNMKTRTLGAQLVVPEVGYGCMGLSGIYGPVDDEASIRLIHEVVDLGVTLLDSSDAYGNGHNETVVGRALSGIRDRVTLVTKFGQIRKPEGTTICGTPEYVKQACEASLKRLNVDCIDLYFQHRVDKTVPIEETVGAMADLVKAGKVRYLGLSEVSVANLRKAHLVHPITAVQSELSIWSRQDERDILPACHELGIGYLAYSPLGRGFLTGTVTTTENLDDKDTRKNHPRFNAENIKKNAHIAQSVQAMAAQKGVTAAQLAIAWVLSKGHDIVPIPGTKSIQRVKENIAAANIVLTSSDITALDSIAPIGATQGDRYPALNLTHIDR